MTVNANHHIATNPLGTQQHPVWWEKTVEYKYVLQHLNEAAAVAPLAGKLTEASESDVREVLNGFVSLIEFKRDKSSISDEAQKYLDGPARVTVQTPVTPPNKTSVANDKDQQAASTGAHVVADAPTLETPKVDAGETLKAAMHALDQLAGAAAHHLIFGEWLDNDLKLRRLQYSKAKSDDQPQPVQRKVQTAPLATDATPLPGYGRGSAMVDYLKELARLRGREGSVTSGGFVVALSDKGTVVIPLSVVLETLASEPAPAATQVASNGSSKPRGMKIK